MLRLKGLFCLLAILVLSDAVAIPATHELHEKRHSLHPRWTKRDRVESHKLFPMRIGLIQSNLHDGYDHLMNV
jgi:tripeptidyl-peptidase-1